MRDMAGRLEPFCKSWICRFWCKGGDVAECHAAQFRRLAGRCCSVWIVLDGVDVRGQALSNVIITACRLLCRMSR